MKEFLITVLFIFVVLLFLHPSEFLMPMSMEASLVILMVAAFLAYLGLIWKERAADERDDHHRLNAGRLSSLAGVTVLVSGILYQNLTHHIDPWLIATLVAMIITKAAARAYSHTKN